MAKVILKKNEERRIKQGHLWVFSNEIQNVEHVENGNDTQSGEVYDVFDSKGNYLASGFYNPHSLIAVRIISYLKDFSLSELLEKRILIANDFRKSVYPKRNAYRMVFSESDLLPGLIIDKYNDTYVLQVYSAGIQKNIEFVVNSLKDKLNAQNIFSKHDEYFRMLEGLPQEDSVYLGEQSEEIISDGIIDYKVNFSTGQKTGFYFDQCDNREFLGDFSENKTVLDCFSNSGGFGLHALKNNASNVTFVDSSANEIENCRNNYALNNFTNDKEFVVSDVFDYLEKCVLEKKKFEIVNIDPPAFAKSKKHLPKAIKAYEKLNRLAMEVVKEGGYVFSSSCSHHLKQKDFIEVIKNAANKAGKSAQILYSNGASLDHPFLTSMEETTYLKFCLVRIIN